MEYIPLGIHAGKGKRYKGNPRPLDEILTENSTYSRGALKRRLIKDGILKEFCSKCGMLPEWQGIKLVLVIDHINGVRDDNRIENLRLLCPNCNSQTSTFAGRNGCQYSNCKHCYVKIISSKIFCSKRCQGLFFKNKPQRNRRKAIRPSIEEILDGVRNLGYEAFGRKYGISGNAIKKWIKAYGQVPPRIHDGHYKHPLYTFYLKTKDRAKRLGVSVCERWTGENGLENFASDMGPKPSRNHDLRILNPILGFCKENCKWSTLRGNIFTFNGEETSVREISKKI